MKPSQVILAFIGIFIILIIGLSTATMSSAKLLAQPSIPPPAVGEPPSIGSEPFLYPAQSSVNPTIPTITNDDYLVYLPNVYRAACSLNAEETSLADLIVNHPEQKRLNMICSPILAQVARERAQDMAQNNYFSHVNLDGNGPNVLVFQAGYPFLPVDWTSPSDLNYIESIAGGFVTASETFNQWIGDTDHQPNILGEDPFWAKQTSYGVGFAYVEDSPYQRYWVFISAPSE